MKNWFWYILGIVLILVLIKQCEQEPKTITKTKIEYVKVTDTITKTIISKPKTVYVERYKTIKGNDTIIYKDKPTDSTIKANEYKTKLLSNNATANLEIVTTGELLDVKGTIDYTQTNTTTTITKIKPKSGLFIYADVPINTNLSNIEAGLLYQHKNTILFKAGIQNNNLTSSADIIVGIGVRIF